MTYTAERYDYEKQAWVGADGRYLSCAHPARMDCRCYGKLHHGELAQVEHSPANQGQAPDVVTVGGMATDRLSADAPPPQTGRE